MTKTPETVEELESLWDASASIAEMPESGPTTAAILCMSVLVLVVIVGIVFFRPV